MKAELDLDLESPKIVKESIEVESDGSDSIDVTIDVDTGLLVSIEADRLSNLRAGINTIFRLIKTSEKAIRR